MSPPLSTSSSFDISHIAGNASDDIKRIVGNPGILRLQDDVKSRPPMFGESIQNRLKVVEISLNRTAEEEKKMEAKVVVELDVTEDMLNALASMHGGCSALLIDYCSTMALFSLNMELSFHSVSQSLNLIYHSPAQLGDKLRIVNKTLTLGARAHSARTEIWNVTRHRLVVSGTHVKMMPSFTKAAL